MKSLTRAEEQVMKVLWLLGSGLLMEIVEAMPKPQPHKNTVATILKTMVEKGIVRIENVGRMSGMPRDMKIDSMSSNRSRERCPAAVNPVRACTKMSRMRSSLSP